MKNLIIRESNLEVLTREGIPKDFADKMKIFNRALKTNAYPYVPRKSEITINEIKNLWIPSAKNNIDIVAELNGKIIGSGTVLMGNDNAYSQESKRESGEYAITIDPQYFDKGIGTKITKRIIEKATKRKIKFSFHTSVDNIRIIKIMEKLGYQPKEKIENYERYAKARINSEVFFYELP